MIKKSAISTVLLAAGLSRRMGCFKPLLSLGTERTIERVVNFFKAGGVSDILVVTGHRAADVCQTVEPLGVRCVENPDYQQGMFTSILSGIKALSEQCRAFFIHPADIPLVRSQSVVRLIAALEATNAAIIYPVFCGRRGHPTLIQSRLKTRILEGSHRGGLRAFLKHHEAESLEVPVADEAVLLDLDTPEDYKRMLARPIPDGLPSDKECRVLLDEIQNLPAPIVAHCQAVSVVGQLIAQALQTAGITLDIDLVRTAAMLHDIARTHKKDHANSGADLLEYHGFSRLAPIVRAHMDIKMTANSPIDETQVVYLADKLVCEDRQVKLSQRFYHQIKKFGASPDALAAILKRRENALHIQEKVEQITHKSIDTILEAV